jgi:hypothetical protein
MRCAVEGCKPVRLASSFKLTGSLCSANAENKATMRSITWMLDLLADSTGSVGLVVGGGLIGVFIS